MKRALIICLLFLFLVSCAPIPTPQILPTPTAISITFDPTATLVPPSPTSTSEVCNPFSADFCIADGHFLFQRPIKPPANDSVDLTYRYGSTANGAREPHHGVEFLNKFGTPVYAAGDGVVAFAGPDNKATYSPWADFYGDVVVIKHTDDLYTLYAHLSKINVEAGRRVLTGDQIGEVGQSGVAIGSHLHFEVRRGDVQDYHSTQNPELWLMPGNKNGKRFGVMEISIVDEKLMLVKYAEFTIKFHLDRSESSNKSYYGVTYPADMLRGDENAAFGDMPAGFYRIAMKYNGQLYERWVEVESGKLTQVVFVVK